MNVKQAHVETAALVTQWMTSSHTNVIALLGSKECTVKVTFITWYSAKKIGRRKIQSYKARLFYKINTGQARIKSQNSK